MNTEMNTELNPDIDPTLAQPVSPSGPSYGQPVLTIRNVSQTFGDKLIIRDITKTILDVILPTAVKGQIVALLGPSGRGKTVLFHRIAGLEKPTTGEVRIGLHQLVVDPGDVGVVFQDYALFEHRTVYGNLYVAAREAGLADMKAQELIEKFLQAFALSDKGKNYPAELSGGQRQRVAIMQQLLRSSNKNDWFLLLMDEPFSGLDPVMIEQVANVIVQVTDLSERNTTVIVTHDVSAAVSIADHIWLMGFERGAQGAVIPGATIVEEIDLVAMGLAWQPNIMELPQTHDMIRQIKVRFKTL